MKKHDDTIQKEEKLTVKNSDIKSEEYEDFMEQ